MKFIIVISIVVTAFIAKIEAEDELKKIPITDCDPKQDSDDVKVTSLEVNATFTDDKKGYGPVNYPYIAKVTFSAEDPEKLLNYVTFDGKEVLKGADFCNGEKGMKIEPPCNSKSESYTLTKVIPAEAAQKLGDVIVKFGFKDETGKTLTCNQQTAYFYKSSSCN